MNDLRRDVPWLTPEYFENRRSFPAAELLVHAGRYVAFSGDGTRILAADSDDAALYHKVIALGLDPAQVVIDYVDPGEGPALD